MSDSITSGFALNSGDSASSPVQDQPWHALPASDAFVHLHTHEQGLDHDEAHRRLEKHGPNRLRPPQRRSALVRFFTQVHNIVIYVMLISALLSALMRHWVDASVILAVVIINTLIGFIQEGKAEKALDAIRKMLSPQADVLRGGRRYTVNAESIVPGDVVALQSGDKVPSDLRLFKVKDLHIDEAILTGESVPVHKTLAPVNAGAALGDRVCMAFSGTLVTSGQGYGVVVATSDHTEIGRISQMLGDVQTLVTPLLQQVATFGRVLSAGIVVLAVFTFIIGAVVWDKPWSDMFLAAVGLAVAAVPEGLPAILTITLALGVQRMASRHAIIRHLPAVDTLGSVTVICTDKTGTLTCNEMTVRSIVTTQDFFEVTGVGYEPRGAFTIDRKEIFPADQRDLLELLRAGLLCNDASIHQRDNRWNLQGDPTEGALVVAAIKAGLDFDAEHRHWPRTDTIPFESEHRFMATLHHTHDGHSMICLKGAPERVLEMCSREMIAGESRPLDLKLWHQHLQTLAHHGMRLLAIARKTTHKDHVELTFADVHSDLTLLGVVGIIDPPRDEAITAIAQCRRAGIRVKMITGDHAMTACTIGSQLGIGDGKTALTGKQLDEMDQTHLRKAANEVDVFARVSPEHKLKLVQAMQANGHVVAMTGDGVNDAPALKRADIGIAMGLKGTEVAKEAADMILADDNFASIAHAVEEGRTVYNNLKKAIIFILPTNGGQAMVILLAVLFGVALPITPVQILWVNMVTAITLALALAFEPAEPDTMLQPPRKPRESLLSPLFLWRIGFVSVILCIGTFSLFLWVRAVHHDVVLARTAAVNTLVFFEAFYLFNTRSIRNSVLSFKGLFGNLYVLLAVGVIVLLQLLYTYLPLSQRLFTTTALDLDLWLKILPVSASVFILVELEKRLLRPA